jgi:hypothetical protein
MNRRDFLVSVGAVAATSTLPQSVAAQPTGATLREREVLRLAQQQLARLGSRVPHRDLATVADFGAHSSEARFYLADLVAGTVQWSCRVAHGTGSDAENDGWLTHFSNMMGSNATSRGAYLTHGRVTGKLGTSVRLTGLDPESSNASDRSIAIHAADYCATAHLSQWGKLGRSNGSFALSPVEFRRALNQLSGGRLLYAGRLELA